MQQGEYKASQVLERRFVLAVEFGMLRQELDQVRRVQPDKLIASRLKSIADGFLW